MIHEGAAKAVATRALRANLLRAPAFCLDVPILLSYAHHPRAKRSPESISIVWTRSLRFNVCETYCRGDTRHACPKNLPPCASSPRRPFRHASYRLSAFPLSFSDRHNFCILKRRSFFFVINPLNAEIGCGYYIAPRQIAPRNFNHSPLAGSSPCLLFCLFHLVLSLPPF